MHRMKTTTIKRGLLLTAALLAIPSPAYAHTVGVVGGVEIELLLLAIIPFVAAFSMRGKTTKKSTIWWLVGAGVFFLGASFVVPRLLGTAEATAGSSDAVVEITAPETGAEVPAEEPMEIEVEVRNAEVAESPSSTEGGHLHVFVDGETPTMVYSEVPTVTLEPGTHSIMVEYTNNDHIGFDPRITDSIEVTAR